MKKVLYFAAIAAMFAACSSEELADQSIVKQDANGTPVNFSVYTPRGTRAGTPNDITNGNIGTIGFGVFAYYTAGEKYSETATPNFMYNQKVYTDQTVHPTDALDSEWGVGDGKFWTYEPVKYWPNEFGDAAHSDDIDYLTFFAYAPYTEIEPTTGEIVPTEPDNALKTAIEQNFNIVSVNKNTATGDPIVKYAVDPNPATSVDLLWGVAAAKAENDYKPIVSGAATVTEGLPFIDLIKPGTSASDKLDFNLKHALAKVKVTIDYVADQPLADGDAAPDPNNVVIKSDETRIYVRSITMNGFATKGALNLNNTTAGEPLWKAFDGVSDLNFDDVTFFDGRKDGKEGTTNGEAKNETPQGLNPNIIENSDTKVPVDGTWTGTKTTGVTNQPQLLFGGDESANGGYFYVIPRNTKGASAEGVNISIVYDVQTIDPKLAGKLADGATLGSIIENVISKENIFGANIDIEAGKVYTINIHIGMTSVKVDAAVTPWDDTTPDANPTLPQNN